MRGCIIGRDLRACAYEHIGNNNKSGRRDLNIGFKLDLCRLFLEILEYYQAGNHENHKREATKMEMIEEIEHKGCKIKVYPDDCPGNPFEDWDATGQFVHWKEHGAEQYRLYCELLNYDPDTREQLEDGAPDPDAVEIDKFEHGCVYYSLRGEGTQCRWDTSTGWAVWMPDKCLLDELKGLTGSKRRAKCIEYARQACELFNQWANGDVYGVVSETAAGESIGSCWGYYGDKARQEGIDEAKSEIDHYLIEAAKITPAALGA